MQSTAQNYEACLKQLKILLVAKKCWIRVAFGHALPICLPFLMLHVQSKKCDQTRLTLKICDQCWKSNLILVHEIYKNNTTTQMDKKAPKHVLQVDYKEKTCRLNSVRLLQISCTYYMWRSLQIFSLSSIERACKNGFSHLWRDRLSSFHANHVFVKHTWLKYHIAHENGQKMILTAQYHSFMSEQSLGIHQL